MKTLGGAQYQARHLDADQDAPVPDHFHKGHAAVRVLVQRLVEEDDASEAAVDAVVGAEENLPELSAVLLRVVHPDLGQTLPHAACEGDMHNAVVIVLTVYLIMDCECRRPAERR